MKHEIIYTDDYALIVSDEYILSNTYILHDYLHYNKIHFCVSCSEEEIHIKGDLPSLFREDCKKVIAHRPLTDAPILEGVPLLPEFSQEEDVKKISEKQFYLEMESPLFEELGVTKKVQKAILIGMLQGTFTRGYNKAKETYKYTEEDLRECCSLIFNALGVGDDITTDEIIQHIQQPKRPKYFECEMEDYGQFDCDVFMKDGEEPKTITNLQGQTVLVGKYI